MLLHTFLFLVLKQIISAGNVPSTLLQWAMTPSPMNQNKALGRYLTTHPLDLEGCNAGVITQTQAEDLQRVYRLPIRIITETFFHNLTSAMLSIPRSVKLYSMHGYVKGRNMCVYRQLTLAYKILNELAPCQIRRFEFALKVNKEHNPRPVYKRLSKMYRG